MSYAIDVSTSPTFGSEDLPTDLFISEYVEGDAGYHAIEVYNGTGADMSTAGYSLFKMLDGGATGSAVPLGPGGGVIIPNNSTYVIAYSVGIAPELATVADRTVNFSPMNFDGNDVIVLRKLNQETSVTEQIDAVGYIGQSEPWGENVTLRRKASNSAPTLSYSEDGWEVFPMNDISGLGSHTMDAFIPSFVPGYEDLGVNGLSQLVSGLTSETDYYYRVRAIGPDGTSINSNAIHVRTLDEGGEIISQIVSTQCGSMLSSINSYISATQIPNATMYRFEVTDIETSTVQTLDRTQYYFSPRMLASYHYSKTYSIRVMVQLNGVWLGYYGPACEVSTPEVLEAGGAATINADQCGGTLPKISALIATTSLPAVTGYRFRVTNLTDPTAPNQVQTIERGHLPWFALTMLDNFNYGTTYSIEVAIRTTDDYSPYSAACEVTTPAVPTLSNCGEILAAETSFVTVPSLDRVSMYRFEITDVQTDETIVVDNHLNWFRFSDIPGYVPGGLYEVRVSLMSAGHYSLPGTPCFVTAPGSARQNSEIAMPVKPTPEFVFEANAYPNPFANSVNIQVNTSSTADLGIRVYDMTGRLIEERTVSAAEISGLPIGEKWPTGVYNLILTQDEQVKTIRVIKR